RRGADRAGAAADAAARGAVRIAVRMQQRCSVAVRRRRPRRWAHHSMPGEAGRLDLGGLQASPGPVRRAIDRASRRSADFAERRLLATKRQDQLDQPDRQRDVAERHHDLIRSMPIQPCKLAETVEEIQDQEDNAKQHDAAADQAVTQITEKNDRRLVARYMRAGRYDQGADDHLFDVTEYFLGGWLDMLGVECKPPDSELPHDLSLRRDAPALSALFERRCAQVSTQRLRDQD